MANIIPEKAIAILYALKNEYVHPEVKEACDLAIECITAHIKIGNHHNENDERFEFVNRDL